MDRNPSQVSGIAITAVMIAVITVLTRWVNVPIPATGGYVHLGDVGVFFAAFAFGPIVGMVAGGVGTALADILGGWASFAPLSLVAHGLQGYVAGLIGGGRRTPWMLLGWLAGSVVLVAGYFFGEWLVYGMGIGAALAEVIPNIGQELAGALGIPLVIFIRKAYPPITRFSRGSRWVEG